jgi:hypothetical protein
MSNEFDRNAPVARSDIFFKFVAGLRLQARAADSVDCTGGIGWPLRAHRRYASIRRGSPAHGMRARRLRGRLK